MWWHAFERERDDFWLKDQGKCHKRSSFEEFAQANEEERYFKGRASVIFPTVLHSLWQKLSVTTKGLRHNLKIIMGNNSMFFLQSNAVTYEHKIRELSLMGYFLRSFQINNTDHWCIRGHCGLSMGCYLHGRYHWV